MMQYLLQTPSLSCSSQDLTDGGTHPPTATNDDRAVEQQSEISGPPLQPVRQPTGR